jgi:hypothetical protein
LTFNIIQTHLLYIYKSQSKDLDLNRMILENKNDSGIILRNNYVTHTSIIHNWYLKPPDIQFEELGAFHIKLISVLK